MSASQFAGAAGQYHVAYCLAVRNIHAAITLGNAPDIDVLASNVSGSRLLSLQVKTARSAYRRKRYGFEVCEWDVNKRIIGRGSPSLWFAFVDLQENQGVWKPRTFIVPSMWVASFVKPDWSRKMYLLKSSLWSECEERWDRVTRYLAGNDPDIEEWCSTAPDRALDWDWPPTEPQPEEATGSESTS